MEQSNSLSIRDYFRPQIAAIAILGIGAGLPFLLVFSTLNYWLAEHGVSKSTIGYFALIGTIYSIKFLWAPVVDHLRLPILQRLGRRRSWILLAQAVLAVGVVGMSMQDPTTDLNTIALFAVLVAFASATQDIAIDAWRIEAIGEEYQALMSAAYIFGYRLGLLLSGGGALFVADLYSWPIAYQAMALVMLAPLVVTLILKVDSYPPRVPFEGVVALLDRTLVAPFKAFFITYARYALALLVFVAIYRISDIAMGAMANPLYHDLGFSKSEVASIVKVFGFFMTIAGAFLCGLAVVRFGVHRMLIVGAVMVATTNLLFAWLAHTGYNLTLLTLVISGDNLAGGVANTAFIAFLSGLTNREYTATQYALMSSFMTLPGKLFSSLSGVMVEAWGFFDFFIACALMGVPSILMAIWIKNHFATR